MVHSSSVWEPRTLGRHTGNLEPPENSGSQADRAGLGPRSRCVDMRRIRDSGKVIGLDRIAVMAALNITHDLLEQRDNPISEVDNTQEESKRLTSKIESALHRFKQMEL